MTAHALSTAVMSLEIENEQLCLALDSAFARGALNVKETRLVQGVLHRRGCETLTVGGLAKKVVQAYRDRVKSAADPGGGGKDASFTQAVKNVQKLIKTGWNYARLLYTVEAYARECDGKGTKWAYRKNVGNFFGRARVFESYLPEDGVVVPNETKAAQVNGLFDGESHD